MAIHHVRARLAGMAACGEGGPGNVPLAGGAAASGCTREGAVRPLREMRAEACRILGVAARSGVGYPQQDRIAVASFADACALGPEAACVEVPALFVALSPDGRLVATHHRQQPLRVWSLETGELRFEHSDTVDEVVRSPDSAEFRLIGPLASNEVPPQHPSFVVAAAGWRVAPADVQWAQAS